MCLLSHVLTRLNFAKVNPAKINQNTQIAKVSIWKNFANFLELEYSRIFWNSNKLIASGFVAESWWRNREHSRIYWENLYKWKFFGLELELVMWLERTNIVNFCRRETFPTRKPFDFLACAYFFEFKSALAILVFRNFTNFAKANAANFNQNTQIA